MDLKKINGLSRTIASLKEAKFMLSEKSYGDAFYIAFTGPEFTSHSKQEGKELTIILNEVTHQALQHYESLLREQLMRCAYDVPVNTKKGE